MCPKRLRPIDGPVPAALSHALTQRNPGWARSLSYALVHHVVSNETYDCVTAKYVAFCEAYSVDPWPAHPVVLGAWILQLCSGIAVQSLGVYLAGVKYSQGLLGYPWAMGDGCDIIRRVQRFVKRKYGLAKKQFKTSVTLQVLRTILPLLPGWPHKLSHDHRMMAAASMIGLMGCLRGGEFTVKCNSKRPTLLHGQVHIAPSSSPRQGVQIDVEHPKGKWWLSKQPVFAFDVAVSAEFGVCSLLRSYREKSIVSLYPTGPAFVDGQGRALTRDRLVVFTEELLEIAKIVQLDPDGQPTKVMSSSWRAGFVRTLKDADVSDPIIMACGRWVSSAWQSYLAVAASDLQHASNLAWASSAPAPHEARRVGISARSALDIATADTQVVRPVLDLGIALVREGRVDELEHWGPAMSASDFPAPKFISFSRSVNRSACNPDLDL